LTKSGGAEFGNPGTYLADPGRAGTDCASTLGFKEATMLSRTSRLWVIPIVAVLVAAEAMLGTAVAQKASVPKPQNKLALGEEEVKQLLPLMETDKNGKISKQEYMKFMEAEFERLDKNKKGELDVKELSQPTLTATHFVGK